MLFSLFVSFNSFESNVFARKDSSPFHVVSGRSLQVLGAVQVRQVQQLGSVFMTETLAEVVFTG